MDIKESKELSFDTQDFPKEVWVFDADNLDQGTEISHLMMSHAEEYTKDELLEICRQASMVIDQLRTELAKAQAVPEVLKKFCNEHKYPDWRGRLTEYDKGYSDCCIAVLEMIEAQEPANV